MEECDRENSFDGSTCGSLDPAASETRRLALSTLLSALGPTTSQSLLNTFPHSSHSTRQQRTLGQHPSNRERDLELDLRRLPLTDCLDQTILLPPHHLPGCPFSLFCLEARIRLAPCTLQPHSQKEEYVPSTSLASADPPSHPSSLARPSSFNPVGWSLPYSPRRTRPQPERLVHLHHQRHPLLAQPFIDQLRPALALPASDSRPLARRSSTLVGNSFAHPVRSENVSPGLRIPQQP